MTVNHFEGQTSATNWEFPGWGRARKLTNIKLVPYSPSSISKKRILGEWKATAICGNDISSSCLYVSALCAAQAGALAPVVLLGVAFVLYLFRTIYAEVGSALPLNGGTYTVLLNTTNKKLAAGAACLTLLSYIATAVISASEAIHYLDNLVAIIPAIPGTIALLGLFAFLAIMGISESAVVALVIFIGHLIMLTTLAILCGIHLTNNPTLLLDNLSTWDQQDVPLALFFGFAAALLGISGFESSANFIEEQKAGVFPKTLRNMWFVVSIFNPLICFLALGMLPLEEIRQVPPDLLAMMGHAAWNEGFAYFVSIDAFFVLCGAVLTSFVGVTGLVKRMSLDRCLPQVLLRENKFRQTNHLIIISFFIVCVSILLITGGDIRKLAGVYTLSFLSVMMLFAIGNMLLKTTRSQLPREVRASWLAVLGAIVFVACGILGNIFLAPRNFLIFAGYYVVAWLFVAAMFIRLQILKFILRLVQDTLQKMLAIGGAIRKSIIGYVNMINKAGVIYFTRGDSPENLNNAALYVLQNEQTDRMMVIHVFDDENDIPEDLAEQLSNIDRLYPQLRIDFLAVKGTFNPQMIATISRKLKTPKNNMFIGTPGDQFPHRIADLDGVRLIL